MIYIKGNVEKIASTPDEEARLKANGYKPFKPVAAPVGMPEPIVEGEIPELFQEALSEPAVRRGRKRKEATTTDGGGNP